MKKPSSDVRNICICGTPNTIKTGSLNGATETLKGQLLPIPPSLSQNPQVAQEKSTWWFCLLPAWFPPEFEVTLAWGRL